MSTNRKNDDDAFGEDDDLYGDLKLPAAASSSGGGGTSARTTIATAGSITSKRPRINHHHPKSLTDQVQELQATVDRLQAENETLKRNMGTLFRTATSELARKDRQLLEARQQLEQQQQQQQQQS